MKWYEIFIVLFGAIGALNIGIGVLLTIEQIEKKLPAKWIYVYIVATTIGVIALKYIIEIAKKGA